LSYKFSVQSIEKNWCGDISFGTVHCSLYADNIMLFMHPDAREAWAVKELLRVFGEASGLHTNLAKCSITPIYGSDEPAATTTDPWVPDVRIPEHLPRPTSEHQEDTQGEDPSNH
jgi:hypothetical protein